MKTLKTLTQFPIYTGLITITVIIFSLIFPLFSEEVSGSADSLKQSDSIREELRWIKAEGMVSITTKHETPISKAPGIVTVITASQIKQMGFRTLVDVLRIVPGFDILTDRTGEREIGVRGVSHFNTNKIKLLIDGHTMNWPFVSTFTNHYNDLVVENAKRIEIIRGPGSALYGRNAFLAVINVITKDTDDIDGFQWTASGGSFDTQNYNMLFGKEYGDLKISGFFDYFDTDGHGETVERDILFPAPFSMSPGRTQNEKEKTDLNLKLSYKNLEFKAKYMKKRKETYIGLIDALTNDSEENNTHIFSELVYKLSLTDRLEIIPKLYYDQFNYSPLFEVRPNGFRAGPFVYPGGMELKARNKMRIIGFENQVNYEVFEGNRLTLGGLYEWTHLHDLNYDLNFHPIASVPLPSSTDFTDTFPYMRKRLTRQVWAIYLQDEWNITKDIDLTVGVRYDNYTRFGGTTNPRLGLTWRFMEDVHLKLLLATAFRAPSYVEMFTANNPSRLGNSDLDPEKINTFEFNLGYNFTKDIRANITYFYNRLRDNIVLGPKTPGEPQQHINSGGSRIHGVEAEIWADFGGDNYAYANYTYQDAEDTRDRNRLPFAPEHKANFGLNMGITKYINANLHAFVSGRRPRESGDSRGSIPSYALVDFTLIGKNFMDNFEIRGSVQNLLDKDYDDPAPVNTVPSDFPQQGRFFFVELRYEF